VHRRAIIEAVLASDSDLPPASVAAAVEAVLTSPAVARTLAAALRADPGALTAGAPPVVGALVAALREHGCALAEPACAHCGATGKPLTRFGTGGLCRRCLDHARATACARCGQVRLVRGQDEEHRPLCGVCADRPRRTCGRCGRTRRIAARTRDGQPDICDACFRMPQATCSVCGQVRPCAFASRPEPVCTACSPRRTAVCAHCGRQEPPTARWPEGPVCDPCYTAALRRRGTCTSCGHTARLVAPPGPAATVCAGCADVPVHHVCGECGTEDKLYERGRCERCALAVRAARLLAGGHEQVPQFLEPVYAAITATASPRTALNWLRDGAGAKVLAELATGQIACSHEALDAHPHRQAANYLRHVLVANDVLPSRDEALVSLEGFLTDTLSGITRESDRRLVQAYATWRVLRRQRRSAGRTERPRTYTAHARANIADAVAFVNWLAEQDTALGQASQGDLDTWLTRGPARHRAHDFLGWAADAGHAQALTVPVPGRNPGPSITDQERHRHLARLLHDDDLDLADRVAGALLLLYGQPLSRITAITTDQVSTRHEQAYLRLGREDINVPEPLAGLLLALTRATHRYLGVGSPTPSNWLFPGMQPGRPLTAARLGERLRALGIRAQPGRRSAMNHLAAQLPAAVIAELLNLAPTTAVRWVRDAGGDWSRYAADLARASNHQP
jgi:hypothetical protein